MTDNTPEETPVIVKGKPLTALPTFVTTLLRYAAVWLLGSSVGAPVVAWLAAHGVVVTVEIVYSVLFAGAVAAWGLYDTWHGKEKQKALADMLPDSKAQVR